MNLPPKAQTEEVICQCYQVNETTIRAAIEKDNLTEIDQITESCEAGGGCHSCHILLQLFIDEHQEKTTSMKNLVNDHAKKVKKRGILSRFFEKIKSPAT
jgi:NAD(P)H-nitrite reductase large subunit